jgi:hypothetical protein
MKQPLALDRFTFGCGVRKSPVNAVRFLEHRDLEPSKNVLPPVFQRLQAMRQSFRPPSQSAEPKGSDILPGQLFGDEPRSPHFSEIPPLDPFFDLVQTIRIHGVLPHDDPHSRIDFYGLFISARQRIVKAERAGLDRS